MPVVVKTKNSMELEIMHMLMTKLISNHHKSFKYLINNIVIINHIFYIAAVVLKVVCTTVRVNLMPVYFHQLPFMIITIHCMVRENKLKVIS